MKLIYAIAFAVFFVAAPVASSGTVARPVIAVGTVFRTTTTRTRLASVVQSLLAKSSRLRRSWRSMGYHHRAYR